MSNNTEKTTPCMQGVIPYISMGGRAGEAADFYIRAFGATDTGRMPLDEKPGQFIHLQVEVNGGALMMTDHGCDDNAPHTGLQGAHLQLVVEGGQQWWNRAVAAGCQVVAPYEMQFWGDYWGLLKDPFGNHWAILEPGPAHRQ